MVIVVVTKRTNDYHACIKGNPAILGCGSTEIGAITDLMISHKEYFPNNPGISNIPYLSAEVNIE